MSILHGYWARVCRRAWAETMHGFGATVLGWVRAGCIFAIALLALWIYYPTQAFEEGRWAVFLLAAGVATFFLFLLWNLFRAPVWLDQERQAEIDDRNETIREKDEQIQELSGCSETPITHDTDIANALLYLSGDEANERLMEAIGQLCQAALDGHVQVWGRQWSNRHGAAERLTPIPSHYWEVHTINPAVVLDDNPYDKDTLVLESQIGKSMMNNPPSYTDLKVSNRQIKGQFSLQT